jgi:hypothetical protein
MCMMKEFHKHSARNALARHQDELSLLYKCT